MARRYHRVDEELFLRSSGGSHEEPLPGPGLEKPTVSHVQPTSMFGRDTRAVAVLAMEGRATAASGASSVPSLELLQEVRTSAQQSCTGPSPLFLVGLEPCQPNPVEQRSPLPELRGHLRIEFGVGEGVGVGEMEGPVPPPVPPRR